MNLFGDVIGDDEADDVDVYILLLLVIVAVGVLMLEKEDKSELIDSLRSDNLFFVFLLNKSLNNIFLWLLFDEVVLFAFIDIDVDVWFLFKLKPNS